ncbi:MAG TPA: hypothetical protein ENN08_05290 [Bacteroidales bacterium]|nr:hypothetical protein [Bacteroidales bacterium]
MDSEIIIVQNRIIADYIRLYFANQNTSFHEFADTLVFINYTGINCFGFLAKTWIIFIVPFLAGNQGG